MWRREEMGKRRKGGEKRKEEERKGKERGGREGERSVGRQRDDGRQVKGQGVEYRLGEEKRKLRMK